MNYTDNHKLLTQDIIEGKEQAYEYIFKVYYLRLCNYAMHYLHDTSCAKDVVQNSIVKLYLNRKDITNNNAVSYLFTILRNECINELKRQFRKTNYVRQTEATKGMEMLYNTNLLNDPEHQFLYLELENTINRAIDNLPQKSKRIYYMSRIEGLKNDEIAQKLDITIKTVEKHITKSNKLIQKYLDNED